MHASLCEQIAGRLLGSPVSIEVPDSLAGPVRSTLGRLQALTGAEFAACSLDGRAADGVPIAIRLTPSGAGWRVDLGGRCSPAPTEEEALLRLQELLIESASTRSGAYFLIRGSIVTRGSQSVIIVGDRGSTHALAAIALTSLGFRLVAVGAAALEDRSLLPLPLPLAFALAPEERSMLEAAGLSLREQLEHIRGDLYSPRAVSAAPEPTHVLFPEAHPGGVSSVRPLGTAAARSRLCQAMLAAPADTQPFAAIGNLLRHTRGIHLTIGDITPALEQLSRLLPRWSLE